MNWLPVIRAVPGLFLCKHKYYSYLLTHSVSYCGPATQLKKFELNQDFIHPRPATRFFVAVGTVELGELHTLFKCLFRGVQFVH